MKTCFMTERARQGQGGTAVTVIYVDTLFLLNALVDYVLLLGAARLAGEPLCRLRFAVGAIVGGGYAVAIFLPGAGFLQGVLCRLAVLALMCVAAYGGSRRLLRHSRLRQKSRHKLHTANRKQTPKLTSNRTMTTMSRMPKAKPASCRSKQHS